MPSVPLRRAGPPLSRALRFTPVWLSLVCGLGAAPAGAQERDAANYDGTWSVRLQGADGRVEHATLVLQAFDGTWQPRTRARRGEKNPCGSKKLPLTVQSSTRSLLAFTVWGETVAPACPNLTVTARPAGDQVLEGAVDLGSHAGESPEVHASHSGGRSAEAGSSAGATSAAATGTAGTVRLTRR